MRYAFAFGADAVYAGQPRYSLRVRENEFHQLDVMAGAIEEAHRLGKKFYIASNIAPHNSKVRSYLNNMQPVIDMRPDALIMSDPGLIMMVRERWPEMPIHLSVQANAVNFATVRFWQSQGLTRVILSRELSIREIREIRQECPEMELEVFVHGALCIAYSGRCLLSGYMNHRDSNQGACTNACRWNYDVQEAEVTPEGLVQLKATGDGQHAADPRAGDRPSHLSQDSSGTEERVFLLEEKNRPGEPMPVIEDEHGTYIMNSRDLRAVEHVPEFVQLGLASLKIEGRTKSHFYVARTAQVYRRAIDLASQHQPIGSELLDDLDSLSNRGYTDGFYSRKPISQLQNYDTGRSQMRRQQFVGEVIERENGVWTIDVKNRFAVGDQLEMMTPVGNLSFYLNALRNRNGDPIDVAPGSQHVVRLELPAEFNERVDDQAATFGLLMRFLDSQPFTD